MAATRIGIVGAGGRMGRALLNAAAIDDRVHVSAALVRPGDGRVGEAASPGNVVFTNDLLAAAETVDVLIDFASRNGLSARAAAAGASSTPWLLCTTGLNDAEQATVVEAAKRTAVLVSANTAIAVQALIRVLPTLAAALDADYDIDITDIHHSTKVDAPSGTALELARAIAGDKPGTAPSGGREVPGVTFHAVRAAAHPGEHRVLLSGPDDTIEITHRVRDRSVFAHGALRSARWLATRSPGLYDMADMLADLAD